MYLKLENFGYWTSKEFTFPDTGTVLISSPSGTGKTTIFKAISFCLFGTGEKLIQYGKRSCSVTMRFKGVEIIRSKGPGKLIVNQTLEDAEAQAFIDQVVAKNQMFYLKQNGRQNFVAMSQMDKLAYLEKIIFDTTDIAQMKQTIKHVIRTRETSLATKQTELASCQTLLDELGQIDPLCNALTLDQLEQRRATLVFRVQHLTEQVNQYNLNLERYTTYKARLDRIQGSLAQLYNELGDGEFTDTTTLEQEVKECREIIRISKEYTEYETISRMVDGKTTEFDAIKKERSDIESRLDELEAEQKKHSETYLKSLVQSLQYKLHLVRSLNALLIPIEPFSHEVYSKYTRRKAELEQRIHMTTYTCPSCETALYMQDGVLVAGEDLTENFMTELNTLTQQIDQYTKYRSQHIVYKTKHEEVIREVGQSDEHSLATELESVTITYKEFQRRETTISNLLDQLDLVYEKYDKLKGDLSRLADKCNRMRQDLPLTRPTNVDDMEKRLVELTSQIKLYQHRQTEIARIQQTIDKFTAEQTHIASQIKTLDVDQTCVTQLDHARHQLQECDQQLGQQKLYTLHRTYTVKISQLELEVKEAEHLLQASLVFKEKITESESTALSALIHTINTSVQQYLDRFFQSDPIEVSLSTQKSTTQHKLSFYIQHKGHSIDLANLSGGEYDRIVLAYALTFAEITHSPMVLLDECTSSLDQETTELVFEYIKEHCVDRLIIVVAHQVITGAFDQTLLL